MGYRGRERESEGQRVGVGERGGRRKSGKGCGDISMEGLGEGL